MKKIMNTIKEVVLDIMTSINESGAMVADYRKFEAECGL